MAASRAARQVELQLYGKVVSAAVTEPNRQEHRLDPVAFRLVREHTVDQHCEGPCFKKPTVTVIPIRTTKTAINGQSGVKYAIARRWTFASSRALGHARAAVPPFG